MTEQARLFTCNKCETQDLPESKAENYTVVNRAYDDPGLYNFEADLCNNCKDQFDKVLAEFGFESVTPNE